MSNIVRDFIWSQQAHGCYGAVEALAALDSERAEHAKEDEIIRGWLSQARQEIDNSNLQVVDLQRTIDFLRQRIAELESQLQDEQP